jgi:hypothetical protein
MGRSTSDQRDSAPIVTTDVPARLDRLPWGSFHWLVVAALGITWILDGLEVTLAGSLAGALRESPALHFSAAEVGFASSAYVTGGKRLFSVTLLLYLLAAAGTAFTWNLTGYAMMRFLTGAGIGGEFSAINSAIQERSTAATGLGQRSAAEHRSYCLIRILSTRNMVGDWLTFSAPRSACQSCCSDGTSRKVLAGYCCTALRTEPKTWCEKSNPVSRRRAIYYLRYSNASEYATEPSLHSPMCSQRCFIVIRAERYCVSA